MRLNKIIQRDYTSFSLYYQIKLPLDLEISIPSDDPVRLVSAFVEEMDLSELYKTYGRIRKNQATPRQMLKLVIYAAMNRIYSSRDIRKACKRDINFMYLLEGMPAPDHATIARFISLHFSACAKVLLARITDAASVLGLTVVGALSATVVTAKTPLAFQMGEVNLAVADLLDKIMPSMISVATVLVLYKLLGKKGMKITTLILIVIIFSMICSALGILA